MVADSTIRYSAERIADALKDRNVEIRAPITKMHQANKLAIDAIKEYARRNGITSNEILILAPNNSWKEFARERLSPDFDGAEIITPYELLARASRKEKVMNDLLFILAYKVLPKHMEETVKMETAKEMVNVLHTLVEQKIDPDIIRTPKFKEAFIEFIKENKVYLKNSYTYQLGEFDAEAFLERFINFLDQYESLNQQSYHDSTSLAGIRLDAKIIAVLNISDLPPLQQEILSRERNSKKMIYTSSNDSIYSFSGADPTLKSMGTENVDYYCKTEIFNLPSEKPEQQTKEGIKARDLVYGAVETVNGMFKSTPEGPVAVMASSNYLAWSIAEELKRLGIPYTAFLSIPTHEGIKEEFINFVKGLLSSDKDTQTLLNAIYNAFSPISVNDYLNHKDEFLSGKKVKAFEPFFELRKRAENKEGLLEVVKEAIERLEKATKDIKVIKTAYTMLERLKNYSPNSGIDLITWLEAEEVSENYIVPGPQNLVVGTPYKILGIANFHTIIYVVSHPRESISIGEAITGVAWRISNKSTKQESITSLLSATGAERVIFVAANYETLYRLGLQKITRSENYIEIERSLLSEVQEYIRNYLARLTGIHYSFLSLMEKPIDLYREILGVRQSSLLSELGDKVHEALAQGKKSEEVDEDIRPFIKNAEELMKQLGREGYEVIGREKRIAVNYADFAKKLGITHINQTNQKDFLDAHGTIDCIMKKGDEYLIIDYKTGQSTYFDEYYYMQLAFYRLLLAISEGVEISKIKMAILHIGLRGPFEDTANAKSEIVVMSEQDYEKALDGLRRLFAKLYEYRRNPDALIGKIEMALARRS
jgi:hypothetical protein